jgi:hypothetical protein
MRTRRYMCAHTSTYVCFGTWDGGRLERQYSMS